MSFRTSFIFIFCIELCFLLQSLAYGQQQDSWPVLSLKLPALIPYREGNLWGYADSTGTIKIQPKYSYAYPFTPEKIAKVAKADSTGFKWGLIDEKGNEFLKPRYKGLDRFISGLAIVYTDWGVRKRGVINQQGMEIVPLLYDEISIENLPGTQTPVVKVTIHQRQPIAEKPNTYNRTITNYGLYSAEGKLLLPVSYNQIFLMNEGLISAGKGQEYTVIKADGTVIIPPGLSRPRWVSDGLILLCNDQTCGFSDLKGRIVIPLKYKHANVFSEGLAGVYQNGKWGFINKKGQMVISPVYDRVDNFQNGFAAVKKGASWVIINKNGVEQTEHFAEDIYLNNFPYLTKLVAADSSYEVQKNPLSGKIKIPKRYNHLSQYHEDLAIKFNDQHQIGYVNRAGKIVIPMVYDEAYPFQNGLARVRQNRYFGVIDKEGKTIIPMAFSAITILGEDLFKVSSFPGASGYMLSGLINREGEEILPAKYYRMQLFRNGLAIVHTSSSMSVVDMQGREIVPSYSLPEGYEARSDWRDGLLQLSKEIKTSNNSKIWNAYMDRYGRVYLKE